MSSYKTVTGVLASAVADAGTFTASYPSGTSRSDYLNGVFHEFVLNQAKLAYSDKFILTFGASSITVTNKSGASWPANSPYILGLDMIGKDDQLSSPGSRTIRGARAANPRFVTLGNPITSDDDGICVSASITSAAGGTIGGALASGGVATMDVPRNVIITSAGNDSAKTFTITGTDEYGVAMKENITGANAGIASGLKAFKTVTVVAIDSNSAGAVVVGCGDVLGLPVFLPGAGHILKEIQDGAAATAGTTVAGVVLKPTATTGDVRGTYDPNAACDGSKTFTLVLALPDSDYIGATQYS